MAKQVPVRQRSEDDFITRRDRHLSRAIYRVFDLQFTRGEGSYLYSDDGQRYIDLFAGIAVHNVGHNHPKVVEAAKKQMDDLWHVCLNYGMYAPAIDLAERLASLLPDPLETMFFGNSGAEAVEGAIKLARIATGRPAIVACRGSFHGRTMGALSMTASNSLYRRGFEPLLPEVYHVNYPYPLWSAHGPDPDAVTAASLREIEDLLRWEVSPDRVAAILIEPVLGEGGYVPAPLQYLRGLRELCDRHGILLILDEVQSGFGRTGKMFAMEHSGIVPDILVMGKALGAGLPISAFVASRELHDKFPPGGHGTTYGGNAVSCAAAMAGLDVIEEEGLVERAARIGDEVLARLKPLEELQRVAEVRGLGCMIGIEFVDEHGRPDAELTEEVVQGCLARNVLILSCGAHKNVVRLIPALNIPDDVLAEGVGVFESVIREAVARRS